MLGSVLGRRSFLLSVWSWALGSVTADDRALNERAPEFELKDQYDKAYSYRFPKSRITILTLGDRNGAEQIEAWVRPVYDRYQDRVEQYGIAVLNAVPLLLRGMVRGMFKNKVKHSVLLDWKGDVAKSLNYQSKQANVVVVNRSGQVVYRTKGAATAAELQKLYQEVDRLLAEAGQ